MESKELREIIFTFQFIFERKMFVFEENMVFLKNMAYFCESASTAHYKLTEVFWKPVFVSHQTWDVTVFKNTIHHLLSTAFKKILNFKFVIFW